MSIDVVTVGNRNSDQFVLKTEQRGSYLKNNIGKVNLSLFEWCLSYQWYEFYNLKSQRLQL